MCKQYEDYSTITKQVAAALARGEFDYAQELLAGRTYPAQESSFVRIFSGLADRSHPGSAIIQRLAA